MKSKSPRLRLSPAALLPLIVFAAGCSKAPAPAEKFEWRAGQGELPAVVHSPAFKEADISVQNSGEWVSRSPQKANGAKVLGGFMQMVYRGSKLQFVSGQAIQADFSDVQGQVEKLDLEKFVFSERVRRKNFELRMAKSVGSPQVVIRPLSSNRHEVLYQLEFVDATGNQAWRVLMNPDGEVIGREPYGSAFADGLAKVFPTGPRWSEVTEVLLREMIGDGSLSKRSHKISHQLNDRAVAKDGRFDFPTEDSRFDQVQVFYYVDRAIGLFGSKFGVTLPFSIEVKTGMGTNAASYFPGTILLGPGDGVNYIRLMRDPTIVTHETCHALVDAVANLPYRGEGGSLNEAFADYCTASIFDYPKLGEISHPQGLARRSISNSSRLSERNGKIYPDSLIISGTLWEIRSRLGDSLATPLAMRTLSRLGPGGNFQSFSGAVASAAEGLLTPPQMETVTQILNSRGF